MKKWFGFLMTSLFFSISGYGEIPEFLATEEVSIVEGDTYLVEYSFSINNNTNRKIIILCEKGGVAIAGGCVAPVDSGRDSRASKIEVEDKFTKFHGQLVADERMVKDGYICSFSGRHLAEGLQLNGNLHVVCKK